MRASRRICDTLSTDSVGNTVITLEPLSLIISQTRTALVLQVRVGVVAALHASSRAFVVRYGNASASDARMMTQHRIDPEYEIPLRSGR